MWRSLKGQNYVLNQLMTAAERTTISHQKPIDIGTQDHVNRDGSPQGVRLRAIIVGMVLAVAICAITPFNNAYRNATPLGGGHFPLAPFFILAWLTVFTVLARKMFKGRIFLTGNELLLRRSDGHVSGIAYTGLVRTFFINLTAPYHFATVKTAGVSFFSPFAQRLVSPKRKGDRYPLQTVFPEDIRWGGGR